MRYLAKTVYSVQGLGGSSTFALAWPAMGNYRVWRGGSANSGRSLNIYWWIDAPKAPLKKA